MQKYIHDQYLLDKTNNGEYRVRFFEAGNYYLEDAKTAKTLTVPQHYVEDNMVVLKQINWGGENGQGL
jgi:hypothetical protein